jgi:uncharacterized protein YjbJ (UPF0337 family)
MEKQILDILNAGIGLFQSGKEGLDKAKGQLQTSYNELVAKGAQDNSEGSIKIRESVDKILTDIKEFSSVAGKNYDETRAKIVENYNKISEEIKSKMPEGKVESVKAKINEVADTIKKSTTKA